MRKDKNTIILEPGDKLYRYDIGSNLPKGWSTSYYSPEYNHSTFGIKNQIGAYFFFDELKVAKKTLAQVVCNKKTKGNTYSDGIITTCIVKEEIILLDLASKICTCFGIISRLKEIGIDILTDKFYNYLKEESFSVVQNVYNECEKRNKESKYITYDNNIEDFFHTPMYLGQLLTDFSNGKEFKEQLIKKGFEGYVFEENPESDTFCLFDAEKISEPCHEEICIKQDKELQGYISKAMENSLSRFIQAQENDYQTALAEVRAGYKCSHWMWYIFPQLKGLGFSLTAQYYGINGREEAMSYLKHPVLGARLREITSVLLTLEGKSAVEIFGRTDAMKLRSCMTLFNAVDNGDELFQKVLDKYYNGQPDERTLAMLK